MLVGAFAGVLSIVPGPPRLVVGGGVLAVILVAELLGRPLPLPQNHRAVPQTVIGDAQGRGALQFGFEMGTGLRTYLPTGLPHALVVAVLVAGGPLAGVLAGLGFGAGRAAMTLLRTGSGAPHAWDAALRRSLPRVGPLSALCFALAAGTLLAAALAGR